MVATMCKLAVYQGQVHLMTFERSQSANWACPVYEYMVHSRKCCYVNLHWELTPYDAFF